jgi:hypothetical protein
VVTALSNMPMHLETLHATHIGRTMTAASKCLKALAATATGNQASATCVGGLALVEGTLAVWRDIATTSNSRLKQRRVREAICDVTAASNLTPFKRMQLVQEIKLQGRVEKKFGTGFDTSKYTTPQTTALAQTGLSCTDPSLHSAPPCLDAVRRRQGCLSTFFPAGSPKGTRSSAQRADKRFTQHTAAHSAQATTAKAQQALLAPRPDSSSEGELSDIG